MEHDSLVVQGFRVIKIKWKEKNNNLFIFTLREKKKARYARYVLKLLPSYTYYMSLEDTTAFVNIKGVILRSA